MDAESVFMISHLVTSVAFILPGRKVSFLKNYRKKKEQNNQT